MHIIDKTYHWYAIYTITNHEKKVNEYLFNCGIEAYLPQRKILKQWSDRKKWVDIPLFPSYIFVRVSCKEYYKVLSHPAALKYVCFENIATPIPEAQINALKKVIDSKLNYEISTCNFKPGQIVKINHGLFSNWNGEVVNHRSESKVVLRMHSIGYSLLINIEQACLEYA